MSYYTYTDRHGDELCIRQHPDMVRVEVPGRLMDVAFEDAPAVALAILEAAGVDNSASRHLAAAWRNLNRHVSERKAEAEREAEATKVREFVEAIPGVSYLDESPEHWQVLYRAAWEFFTREEKPAPRVLNYGDPEPDAGTWRSSNDVLYQKDAGGWSTVSGCYSVLWSNFNAGAFPMTEVTE